LLAGATVVVSREDAPSGSEEFPTATSSPTSRIQAAAILFPPGGGAKMNTTPNAIRAGFLGLIWHCGPRFIWKLLTGLVPAMEALQVRMHPDPVERDNHFTLLFLAARPDMQGKGLGKKILIELQRIVSEAAKATEIVKATRKDGKDGPRSLGPAPLYLEASTPTSKRLYERVGFVQRDTLIYGKLDEDNGKDLDIKDNGEVIGGRMFAMFWSPL
jgi:GNAT superfamily N-acetyltransferase